MMGGKMPFYSWLPIFMTEFNRLTRVQQKAFLAAVKQYIVNPLNAGDMPSPTLFHKMSGHKNIWEFRWDPSGRFRATCRLFKNDQGVMQVEWRRMGSHSIYDDP
jgi:hypothetical protein